MSSCTCGVKFTGGLCSDWCDSHKKSFFYDVSSLAKGECEFSYNVLYNALGRLNVDKAHAVNSMIVSKPVWDAMKQGDWNFYRTATATFIEGPYGHIAVYSYTSTEEYNKPYCLPQVTILCTSRAIADEVIRIVTLEFE